MRYFKYLEQQANGITLKSVVISEEEILQRYFVGWAERLVHMGRAYLATKEHCIEDFVEVHCARQTEKQPIA